MSSINYKQPVTETCEGSRVDGSPCGNPAKMGNGQLDGRWLCGVHGGPILRRRAQMGAELLHMELWSRGAYSQLSKRMTTEELRERIKEIKSSPWDLSEARKANLRAEEHELQRELALR